MAMNYLTNNAKLDAFQRRDPFAASSFYICNSDNKTVCRSNCDVHNINVKRSTLLFIDDMKWAFDNDYKPCQYSLPEYVVDKDVLVNSSFVSVDLKLLMETVATINEEIGFIPPADFDVKDISSNGNSKSNPIIKQESLQENTYDEMINRSLVMSTTKSDYERLKLVNIACRHLALAAMTSISDINVMDNEQDMSINSIQRGIFYFNEQSHKTKRGGVLGFKELAQKCNMSPWHFHRVFKSITNVTPKTYGDKCSKFIQRHKMEFIQSFQSCQSIIISTKITGINDENLFTLKKNSRSLENCNDAASMDNYTYKKRNSVNQNYNLSGRRKTITTVSNSDSVDSCLNSEPFTLTHSSTSTLNFPDEYLLESNEVNSPNPMLDSKASPLLMAQSSNTPQAKASFFNENFHFNSNVSTDDHQIPMPSPVPQHIHQENASMPILNEQFLLHQLRRQGELSDKYTKHQTLDHSDCSNTETDDFLVDRLINWTE